MLTSLKPKKTKCRHCKRVTDGKALHDDCVAPWFEANREKLARRKLIAQRKCERAEKAQDREKRKTFKTINQLIAKAQASFNAWIRWRDKDKGCFVCGRSFDPNTPGRAMHAGHVRSRGAAGHLRFIETNCLGECEGCNGPHGAKPHQIKEGAIKRIGQAEFDALEANNTPHKWTRDEVIAIDVEYRARLKAAKKEQPCNT